MKESDFQKKVIKRLKEEFPNCVVMKQDATYKQGIPDLVVFFGKHYAMLECKISVTAHHQPWQDYYIRHFNEWSYASFVYPSNLESVIEKLKEVFASELCDEQASGN